MKAASLDVEIRDSPFDPDDPTTRRVEMKRPDSDRPLYRVFLYLSGTDVPFVEEVTYHLHSTFPNRERTARRTSRNRSLKVEIWTWGIFEVTAVVTDLKGRSHRIGPHRLGYDQLFSSKGVRFVERRPDGELRELGVVE